jgi:hypothetical protein
MKQFIKKIISFAVPALVIVAVVLYIQYDYRSKYSYKLASNIKHRLLGAAPSPKMVIVGDSSVGMGIDSELIHRRYGLPVVNMGLHNAYGLHYMLSEVDGYLKKGDIVITLPEYAQYLGRFRGVGSHLWELYTVSPGSRPFFATAHYVEMMKDFPRTFQLGAILLGKMLTGTAKKGDKLYDPNALNRFGDTIAHLNKPSPRDPTAYNIVIEYDGNMTPQEDAGELLNGFYHSWKERGITFLLSFPPFAEPNYRKENYKTIEKIETWIKQNLEMPVLGTHRDFIYPGEYFYDTAYHLNTIGRQKRTRRLIQLLDAYITPH